VGASVSKHQGKVLTKSLVDCPYNKVKNLERSLSFCALFCHGFNANSVLLLNI
jgi:hypothetical protein